MKLPKGTFVVGNKLMMVCGICGKIVRIDKPVFGALHFCAVEEDKYTSINLGKDKTGTMEQGIVIKK